jgi:uncharacterized cupin superfamily protein
MAELKYAKNIITDTKPMSPDIIQKAQAMRKKSGSTVKSTRLLWMDDETAKGAFYMEYVWLWGGRSGGSTELPHAHDFDEVLGFVGTNGDDPNDLGGEIELWLDDEKYALRSSCLVFVPKGVKHCPLMFNRIDSPILFFTIGNGGMYGRSSEDKMD